MEYHVKQVYADNPACDSQAYMTREQIVSTWPWMNMIVPRNEGTFFVLDLTVDLWHLTIQSVHTSW